MATQVLRMTPARRAKPARRRTSTASTTIALALQEVAKRQREICQGSVSSKSLHVLRVTCRRAEAALRLAMGFAKHRDCKKLIKRLQTIRDACNAARDDDVLRHWLRSSETSEGKKLAHSLKKRRDEALSPVIKAIGNTRGSKEFSKAAGNLMQAIRRAERKEPVQPALGRYLLDELQRFVSRLDIRPEDESTVHQLRISGKRLRYSCEFAVEILADSRWTPLIKYLEGLQDRAGAIHDQAVGIESLGREKNTMDARQYRSLEKKVARSTQQLDRAFWKWWQSHNVTPLVTDALARIVELVQYRA
jgi:CHAD domain-containing protein